MNKRLLHTPEGVRDIYGKEYAEKLSVEAIIRKTISLYGYSDIQTPTFEYFDIFSREIGTTPSNELYKFFDNEGNTLVLRPDFTPSMARCAAKYFVDSDEAIRFCYCGNTFTNTPNHQGKLKEVTEIGVELIGDESVYADAEVIALVVNSLKNTGLVNFRVTIGEIEYFKGLCQEAGLDEDTEYELRSFISGKNYFAAQDLLNTVDIPQIYKDKLLKVADMFGAMCSLDEAECQVTNSRSLNAIKRLKDLYEVLKLYGVADFVSFDLGMLSKYNYYTGVIFKAYTYGLGTEVVKGGRYDNLLHQFGKDAPSIGFVIVIDDLLEACKRQRVSIDTGAEAVTLKFDPKDPVNMADMLKKAMELREQGTKVELKSIRV